MDSPGAILRAITTSTGRVSGKGDPDSLIPAQITQGPVWLRLHTPPAEDKNLLGKPTETAQPLGATETFKELRPSLEKWFPPELKALILLP